ncbi:MAG: hypothetical protein ACE5H3_04575 [Planctomycetota bacterium]
MSPPLASLLLVLFGPPAGLLVPLRLGLPAGCLLVLGASWSDGGTTGLVAAGLLFAATAFLRCAARRRIPLSWLLGSWAALLFLPSLAWAACEPLGTGFARCRPPALAWLLWPPASLTGSGWDPLRNPPFYATWGSATPLPPVFPFLLPALLALLAAVLYFSPPFPPSPRR